MSPETQKHIFEPFYTTKEQGRGTGLGLSTVYGIVKQSNGYIIVYSNPGKGSTFKILFPVAEERADSIDNSEKNIAQVKGTETILVVEDDDDVMNIIVRILTEQGYNILKSSNGDDALNMIHHRSGPIHLLLTDTIMPKMDGKVLADRVQLILPEIKCMFMSGYPKDVLSKQGLKKSDINFLQKPFSAMSLLQKVREVLGHSS